MQEVAPARIFEMVAKETATIDRLPNSQSDSVVFSVGLGIFEFLGSTEIGKATPEAMGLKRRQSNIYLSVGELTR